MSRLAGLFYFILASNASGYRTAANCILYRAQALREVNYYIPNLDWRTCEDWDMTFAHGRSRLGQCLRRRRHSQTIESGTMRKGVRAAARKMSEVMTNDRDLQAHSHS
jgi:hypothetical protein